MQSILLSLLLALSAATSSSIPLVDMDDASCVELSGHGVAYDETIVKLALEDAAPSGVTLKFYKASASKKQGETNYVFFIVGPRHRDDAYWVYTVDDATTQYVHKFEYYSQHRECGWSQRGKA
jgi:hypothetical protein